MSSLRISARFSTEYGNPYTCPSYVKAATAASDNSLAKSPSSIGSTTPLAVNSPSQSCAPTVRSGPSPVGTCAKKSGRISSKFLSTSSTVAPVSSSNCSTVEASAVARVSSTQIVRLPPSASGVSSVVASSGASGVSSGLSDPPPHPARAKPKISTAAIPGYRPKCVYGPGVSAASGPAFSGPKAFFGAEAGVVFGWAEGFFFHLRRGGGARVFELLLGGLPGVVGELSQSI